MTDGNVMRYFPSSQCLWPAIDEMKIRELADKHTLSHQELGRKIRRMFKPVHYTGTTEFPPGSFGQGEGSFEV